MKRRLATILAIAALLCLSVSPATAAPVRHAAQTAPRADTARNCGPDFSSDWLTGTTNSSAGTSRSGASATINVPSQASGFSACFFNLSLQTIGPAVYVGIEPRGNCCAFSGGTGGLYLGIIRCDQYAPPVTYCHGNDDPAHAFYATNLFGSSTIIHDLGAVDDTAHTAVIYLDTDLKYHFIFDGSLVTTVPLSTLSWQYVVKMAVFSGHTFMKEDSFGNSNTSSTRTAFTNAAWGFYGGGWQTNTFNTSAPCAWTNDVCLLPNQQTMYLYSPN